MDMTSVTMEFDGVYKSILENLIQRGIFKTKSEAVRNGLLGLGEKYGIVEHKGGHEIYRWGTKEYAVKDWLKGSFKGGRNLSSRIDEIVGEG